MIRAATAFDLPAIRAIWNAVIRDTTITFTSAEKTEDEISAFFIDRTAQGLPVLVADEGGVVFGFATYAPFRTGPGYARTMEHSVILAPHAQGRGLGRTLMTTIEAHARGAHVHSLIAGVSGTNAQGLAFHAAIGFVEVGRLPDVGRKFDRWLDLVLMQKFL